MRRRCRRRRCQPLPITVILGTGAAPSTLIHARALGMFVDKNRAAIFNALLIAARANDEALFELGLELDSTANIVGVLIWRLARANGVWTVFAAVDTIRIARARVHTAIVVSGTLRFASVIGATCD